jgi:hypothetical protein
MPPETTHTSTRRWTGTRIASAVAGLMAVGSLIVGGLLLWADASKDDDGYFNTARESFATDSYALASDNLDLDLDGAGWIIDNAGLGEVRLDVEAHGDKPVFVGIARTSDVAAYLGGTAHTRVTDVEWPPFHASYREQRGEGRPERPADQRFWAASAHGTGTQTVTWDAEDGDWAVVVMNEDASRTVDTKISAGTKAPFLGPAGWVAVGGGVLMLAVASLLAVSAGKRRDISARPVLSGAS